MPTGQRRTLCGKRKSFLRRPNKNDGRPKTMASAYESMRHPPRLRHEETFLTGYPLPHVTADGWQTSYAKPKVLLQSKRRRTAIGRRQGLQTLAPLSTLFLVLLVLACPETGRQQRPAFLISSCEKATPAAEEFWLKDVVPRARQLSGSRSEWDRDEEISATEGDRLNAETAVSSLADASAGSAAVAAGTLMRVEQQRSERLDTSSETEARLRSSRFASNGEVALPSLGYILEPPYNAGDGKKKASYDSLRGQQLDSRFVGNYFDETLQNHEEDRPEQEDGRGRAATQEDQPPSSHSATEASGNAQAQTSTEPDKKKKSSFTLEFKFGTPPPLPTPAPPAPLLYVYPFLDKDKLHLFVNQGAPFSGSIALPEDPGLRQESPSAPVAQYPLLNTSSIARQSNPEFLVGSSSLTVPAPVLPATEAAATPLRSSASHYYDPASGVPYESLTPRGYAANITGGGIAEPVSVRTEPRDVHFVFHVPDLVPSLQSSQTPATGPPRDSVSSTTNTPKSSFPAVPATPFSPALSDLSESGLPLTKSQYPGTQIDYTAAQQDLADLWFLSGQGTEPAGVPPPSARAPGNPPIYHGGLPVPTGQSRPSLEQLHGRARSSAVSTLGALSTSENLALNGQNPFRQKPQPPIVTTEPTAGLPAGDGRVAPPAALPQLSSLFALLTGIDADKLWRFFTGDGTQTGCHFREPEVASPFP